MSDIFELLQAKIADLQAQRDRLISEQNRAQGDLARLRGLLRACVDGWERGEDVYSPMQAARKEVEL